MGKTKGVFYNKQAQILPLELPRISWVQNIFMLGINFGSIQYQNSQWYEKFDDFKKRDWVSQNKKANS